MLERGATREIRLRFSIPDIHRATIKIIWKRTTSIMSTKKASR